jgi:hypothetical protein
VNNRKLLAGNCSSRLLVKLTLDWQRTILNFVKFELLEAMWRTRSWRTRSTPEEDTHFGQPCGESSAGRELVHLPQRPSQTFERAPASPYPSTTTPTSAMGTQTSDKSPLNNDAINVGKRNEVSQKGRRNRAWNRGDENRVSQDSREYEQTIKSVAFVFVVGIISWAFIRYIPTI